MRAIDRASSAGVGGVTGAAGWGSGTVEADLLGEAWWVSSMPNAAGSELSPSLRHSSPFGGWGLKWKRLAGGEARF